LSTSLDVKSLSKNRGSFSALRAAGKSFGSKASSEVFFCSECGTEHINWMGRCTSCKQWNTVKPFRAARDEVIASPLNIRARAAAIKSGGAVGTSAIPGAGFSSSAGHRFLTSAASGFVGGGGNSSLVRMDSVKIDVEKQRIPFSSQELNRVLGGGLVKGSVVLLAGEPGVGKSTLLLQMAASVVEGGHGQVVYISGEENAEQVVSRARRLGLDVADLFLICDIDADDAIDTLLSMTIAPAMVIVDSVQTMRTTSVAGSVGSVTQTRESAARFVQLAKATSSAVVLAGHVTKTGEVAGPRILEHMVDAVLYLEGSDKAEFRLLRGVKNRFGSTAEVGVLGMGSRGLTDVANPSQLFLSQNIMNEGHEGAAVAVVMEGSRALLAEIQCLVSMQAPQAKFNTKRMSDGFPIQRLLLICAVIEKRLRLPLCSRDIYVNVAGGLRVSEPCSDLAVAITVISSMTGAKIRAGTALIGELGLGGELRGGKGLEQRIAEAKKMGFTRVVVPMSAGYKEVKAHGQTQAGGQSKGSLFEVVSCRSLKDALVKSFENVEDVEAFLKPSRKTQRQPYGMGSYRPSSGTNSGDGDGDGDGNSGPDSDSYRDRERDEQQQQQQDNLLESESDAVASWNEEVYG